MPSIKQQFKDTSKGGTQQFVSLGMLRSLKIQIPPLELQHKFTDVIQFIDEELVRQSECNDRLNDLFNSLMNKCMSGEVS